MNPTRAHWIAVWSFARHKKRARNKLLPLVDDNILRLLLHMRTNVREDALAIRWAYVRPTWRSNFRPLERPIKGLMAQYPLRLTPRDLPWSW